MQTLSQKVMITSLAASLTCLAAGAALGGRWEGSAAAAGMVGLVWLSQRWPRPWMPSTLLGVYTVCAGAAILAGGAPLPLLVGIVFALSAWDLEHSRVYRDQTEKDAPGRQAVSQRLLLTAGAAGLSLLLIGLGEVVQLRLPFGVVVFLALAALVSLTRLVRLFQKDT